MNDSLESTNRREATPRDNVERAPAVHPPNLTEWLVSVGSTPGTPLRRTDDSPPNGPAPPGGSTTGHPAIKDTTGGVPEPAPDRRSVRRRVRPATRIALSCGHHVRPGEGHGPPQRVFGPCPVDPLPRARPADDRPDARHPRPTTLLRRGRPPLGREVKWDGQRSLVYAPADGTVRLRSRSRGGHHRRLPRTRPLRIRVGRHERDPGRGDRRVRTRRHPGLRTAPATHGPGRLPRQGRRDGAHDSRAPGPVRRRPPGRAAPDAVALAPAPRTVGGPGPARRVLVHPRNGRAPAPPP